MGASPIWADVLEVKSSPAAAAADAPNPALASSLGLGCPGQLPKRPSTSAGFRPPSEEPCLLGGAGGAMARRALWSLRNALSIRLSTLWSTVHNVLLRMTSGTCRNDR